MYNELSHCLLLLSLFVLKLAQHCFNSSLLHGYAVCVCASGTYVSVCSYTACVYRKGSLVQCSRSLACINHSTHVRVVCVVSPFVCIVYTHTTAYTADPELTIVGSYVKQNAWDPVLVGIRIITENLDKRGACGSARPPYTLQWPKAATATQ